MVTLHTGSLGVERATLEEVILTQRVLPVFLQLVWHSRQQ